MDKKHRMYKTSKRSSESLRESAAAAFQDPYLWCPPSATGRHSFVTEVSKAIAVWSVLLLEPQRRRVLCLRSTDRANVTGGKGRGFQLSDLKQ